LATRFGSSLDMYQDNLFDMMQPASRWPDKMVLDKMVRTKWYGQNGSNLYRFQFNWIEFLFGNHKLQI